MRHYIITGNMFLTYRLRIRILQDPQSEPYIRWSDDGTEVVIPDQAAFSKEVLSKKFKTAQVGLTIRAPSHLPLTKSFSSHLSLGR